MTMVKKIVTLCSLSALLIAATGPSARADTGNAAPAPTPPKGETSLLIQGEDFQFPGSWTVESNLQTNKVAVLHIGVRNAKPDEPIEDAVTVVEIPQTGTYQVWTRSRDYSTSPGKRTYQLLIDGKPAEKESGGHGYNGWLWEKVDTRELKAGPHVLALHDSGRFYARCDAIFITTGDVNPGDISPDHLESFATTPASMKAGPLAQQPPHPAAPQAGDKDRILAELQSSAGSVRFFQSEDEEGQPVVRTDFQAGQGDEALAVPTATHPHLQLLFSPTNNINVSNYYPTWDSEYNQAGFELNGQTYTVAGELRNPFLAGHRTDLVPRTLVDASPDHVTLEYQSTEGWTALGRWQAIPNGGGIAFSVELTAPETGWYSLIFSPFAGLTPEQVTTVQLPPVFQMHRIPDEVVLVPSSLMPHPFALVETEKNGRPLSYTVVAEPEALAFEWPTNLNAEYGFSILDEEGQVAPVAFSPVLGLKGSEADKGQPLSARWRLTAIPTPWGENLTEISENIMGVTDYRRPWKSSLTDAAMRMIDLLADDTEAGGWDPQLKGYYNIEFPGGATQASPLTVLSAAVLTRDEDFYRERALPAIEFMLSRPSFHFATGPGDGAVNEEVEAADARLDEQLTLPIGRFGTEAWEGVDVLTGGLNGWITEVAFTEEGEPRYPSNSFPSFSQYGPAHNLNPQDFPTSKAVKKAKQYIAANDEKKQTRPKGIEPHYNVAFHPHWWTLLDLYDRTGDEELLKAAEQFGYHTIAGQWSRPPAPAGDIVIHPGGEFAGMSNLIHIWHGWDKVAIGYPRQPGDVTEHEVPAWVVSPVGLPFEQPITYFATDSSGMRMTMMSSWVGHLERLADRTGKEIFRTYARNAIIGRWSNWPGYYLNGFTDIFHNPDYPYEGPDVNRFYNHHIPVQLAFTLDFLVAQMEDRSGHRIQVPWVRQQGYAQFTNRIYGGQPATFFGQEADLWLDPDLLEVSTIDVDYLTARGEGTLWIVLMNERNVPVQARVSLNHALAGTEAEGAWKMYDNEGKATAMETPVNQTSLEIPADGLVALALPASLQPEPALQPLSGGHVTQPLPGNWGDLHAFRIRSPFGKDALYLYATGNPGDGSVLEVAFPQGEQGLLTAERFPFEVSLYPWPMDRDALLEVSLVDADGAVVATETISLPSK